MARTRIQHHATAADARSQQANRTGATPKDSKRSRRPSKVQFSEVVHVKSIPNKDDQHGSSPSEGTTCRRELYGADSSQIHSDLKSHQTSNVRTMSDLPSPPATETSLSHRRPVTSEYDTPGTSNVHTLTEFAQPVQRGPGSASRPVTPPNIGRAPAPPALADVGHHAIDRRSSLIATPSPKTVLSRKRARADESSFYDPPAKRVLFEYDAATDLKKNLPHDPRALSPEEISALFESLRARLQTFADHAFNNELTAAAQEDWPLHEMDEAYYPLMLTAQYLSDGSQYGWRHFFTTPDSRSALAYGVIGEYLRHHIFSAPVFGFSPEDTKMVEDIDSEFLHYDSHVRARRRAYLFKYILSENDWQSSSRTASHQLAQDLLAILTPLLGPEIFRHDEKTGTFSVSNDASANTERSRLLRELSKLIRMAVGLHYSIRLTGANGSIVRFCNTLNKGEKWFGDYDAPQNCVNKDMIQKTQFHGWLNDMAHKRGNALQFADVGVAEGPDDNSSPRRPRIKMVCFPRIEMVVPRGPDRDELQYIQDCYKLDKRRIARSAFAAPGGGDDDPSDGGSDSDFDEGSRRRSSSASSKLSGSRSHGKADADSDDDDDSSVTPTTTSITDLNAELDWDDIQSWYKVHQTDGLGYFKKRDQIWEQAPDMVRHQYEQREGKWDEEKNGELRLPYQLHYQWISPNDVYLEHDYVEPTPEGFVEDYFQEHSEPIVPPVNADQLRRVNRERHQLPRRHRAGLATEYDDSGTSSASSFSSPSSPYSDDDDASSTSSSNTSSPNPTPTSVYSPQYDWAPGHSRTTALVAYKHHIAHLRSTFLAERNARTGWRHGNPLPADQRVSLQEAVRLAREAKARESPRARVRFAATDASRAVWNAVARRATAVEWGASGLAVVVGLVWFYRRRGGLQGAGPGVTEMQMLRAVGAWVERTAGLCVGRAGEAYAQFKAWLEEADLQVDEMTTAMVAETAAETGRTIGGGDLEVVVQAPEAWEVGGVVEGGNVLPPVSMKVATVPSATP